MGDPGSEHGGDTVSLPWRRPRGRPTKEREMHASCAAKTGRLRARDRYSARRKKAIGIGRGLAPSRRGACTSADTSMDAGTVRAAIGGGRTWNW